MKKMKNKIGKIFFAGFVFLLFFTNNSFASPSRNLTVFAEPNMALALTKIARLYSQKSNVTVSVNFNSSYDLINEVDSGEPADVFISAHSGWIENLRQKGLVDVYNIAYIAEDKLVLAALKSNPAIPTELLNQKISLEDALKTLDQTKSTLVVDNKNNSSGFFGNNFLENHAFADLQLIIKLPEDKSPFLNIVKNHSENYSLLLASQVKNDSDFQIIATKNDEKIFYQALVIAGDNMEIAREFLKFLQGSYAKSILEQSGFEIK
jgi:molybdate transport system substrate-binding protein